MKKTVLSLLFLGVLLYALPGKPSVVYAQRIPSVGILPIQAAPGPLSTAAANLTRQVVEELSSWGTLSILTDGQAAGAEYVVRSTLVRQGNLVILSAETTEASTGRKLNDSAEQAPNVNDISVFNFCTKVVENVPFPNYLLGKWQSTISLADGQITCIIEFKTNRVVEVEQYETWERRQNNALKYEGYGSGSYGYAGYSRRAMTVPDGRGGSRQIMVDATISVNLKIEEALTEYTTVNQGGLRLLFDDTRNSFEIVSGGLPCGRNYDGRSDNLTERLFFTRFTKIR
jgi:hypothetical protein